MRHRRVCEPCSPKENSPRIAQRNLSTLGKEEVLFALEMVAPFQHVPPRCDDRADRPAGQVPAVERGHLASDDGAQDIGGGDRGSNSQELDRKIAAGDALQSGNCSQRVDIARERRARKNRAHAICALDLHAKASASQTRTNSMPRRALLPTTKAAIKLDSLRDMLFSLRWKPEKLRVGARKKNRHGSYRAVLGWPTPRGPLTSTTALSRDVVMKDLTTPNGPAAPRAGPPPRQ